MRIAIFTDTFFPQINGVAQVAYQSAEKFSELGHEVMVFTATAPSNKLQLTNNKKYKHVFYPSFPAGVYPGERAAIPLILPAFLKLKKFDPEVIHSHTPFTIGWEAVLLSKLLGVKLVGTHHTFYDHYLKHANIDFRWAKRFSWKYTVKYYNMCDLIISPSQSLADELIQHGLKKPIKVLINQVDTDRFTPVLQKEKEKLKANLGIHGDLLMYMGRVSYEKSIDEAIKAFALATKENPKIHLAIIGDGPEKETLEKLTRDLSIEKSVSFTGFLKDKELTQAIQAGNAFITASKSENMPLSVLEAMATGLPIIGTIEKGIPEIVQHGLNGYLSKGDDTKTMSENIIKLFSDKKVLRKLSSASRTFALEHSSNKVFTSLAEIYKNLEPIKST